MLEGTGHALAEILHEGSREEVAMKPGNGIQIVKVQFSCKMRLCDGASQL